MRPAVREIALLVFGALAMDESDLPLLEQHVRTNDLVRARHITWWLARRALGLSFPVLGKEFGGRDHTTIQSGVKKVERAVKRFRASDLITREQAWVAKVALDLLHALPGPEKLVPGIVATSGAREIDLAAVGAE